MGWFKRLSRSVLDPLLPESVKKNVDALLPEQIKENENAQMMVAGLGMGITGAALMSPTMLVDASVASGGYSNTGGPEGAIVEQTKEDVTGRLTEEEAQAASQKRLARLSRYYTTARGDVSPVSTASQKVFS